MREKLRNHINLVFEGAPNNRKIGELKEELLQNLFDKYDDMVSEGKSNEEAYNAAIRSIGDVSELIEQLSVGEEKVYINEEIKRYKKQSATLISIAVALYIICVIPIIVLQNIRGVIAMFVIIALATAMIIYNSMTKPDKFIKTDKDDDMAMLSEDNKQKVRLINKIVWPIVVLIYLLVSFYTCAWGITWIIFIIGGIIENIIKAIIELNQGGNKR